MATLEKPSFFKIMITENFRTTMRIPPAFAEKLGVVGDRWGSVIRSSRMRRQWEVKMEEVDGQVYFRGGWENFVADHGIQYGDFLLFFYSGGMVFDVKIYGITGCEKYAPVLPAPAGVVKIETDSEETVDEEKPTRFDRKRKAPTCARKGGKKIKNKVKKSKLCYNVFKSAKLAANENALKAACAFRTSNPHFVTTCRGPQTTYMTIPIEFATDYKLDQKDSIILRDPHGTSWPIKLSSWRDGRRCFTSGWTALYKNNQLTKGDVCILELVEEGSAINIHIFHSEEYTSKEIPTGSCAESSESDHSGKNVQVKEPNRSNKSKQKKMVDKLTATEELESNSVQLSAKEPDRSHKSKQKKMVDKLTATEELDSKSIPVSGERTLSEDARERILNAAKFLESSHPKFFTAWTSSRLYHVPIPKKVAIQVGLKGNQSTTIIDPSERSWHVNITFRSHGQVELGVGWSHVSRANNLAVGDVCIFEFLEGSETIKLHINRRAETSNSPGTAQG